VAQLFQTTTSTAGTLSFSETEDPRRQGRRLAAVGGTRLLISAIFVDATLPATTSRALSSKD